MTDPATYILDLDGVVYLGKNIIPGAYEAINHLRDAGRRVIFLTNNSTRSRESVASRLESLGIGCNGSDVITSAYAASVYIKEQYGPSTVYCIGEPGLLEELEQEGHTIAEQDVDKVLVGLDKEFNYHKLKLGLDNLRAGAGFIATNTDALLPTESGFLPGAGSMVAALKAASGKDPIVIGKPNKPIMDVLLKEYGLKREECVMIGDRLETDILAGINAGMRTVLVLTGASGIKDIELSGIQPDTILDSLVDLSP
jgi:4-nitrophenyl phosphatase